MGWTSAADQVPALHGGGIGCVDIHYSAGRAPHCATAAAAGNPNATCRIRFPPFAISRKQREVTLERSAALLADLPIVRSLMTTHHAATIQDASHDLWNLAGSDLLLLADPSGKVMALQASPPECYRSAGTGISSQDCVAGRDAALVVCRGTSLRSFPPGYLLWPRGGGQQVLGYLVLGYEIDDRVAHELSQGCRQRGGVPVRRHDCAEHA